jgi:hypothetical protein
MMLEHLGEPTAAKRLMQAIERMCGAAEPNAKTQRAARRVPSNVQNAIARTFHRISATPVRAAWEA